MHLYSSYSDQKRFRIRLFTVWLSAPRVVFLFVSTKINFQFYSMLGKYNAVSTLTQCHACFTHALSRARHWSMGAGNDTLFKAFVEWRRCRKIS